MVIYALSKALPGLISFIYIMFLIRVLDNKEYGAYALTLSVVMASTAFGSGWVKQAVIRYRSAFNAGEKFYRRVIIKAIFGSVLLFLSIFLIVENVVLRTAGINNVAIATAYFAGVFAVVYGIRQGELQAAFAAKGVLVMETTRTFVLAVVSICLVMVFGLHYELALLALAFSFISGWFVVQKTTEEPLLIKTDCLVSISSNKANILQEWWRYGWPLSLWLGCIMLMQVTDKMTIQYFYGLGVAGQYSGTYDLIVRGYGLFVYPVTLAIHPKIMKSVNTSNKSDSKKLIYLGIILQIIIFIPALVLSFYFKEEFFRYAIGVNNKVVTDMVVPLVLAAFFWQLAIIVHKPLEIAGKTRLMLGFALLALILNGILNWMLVPKFGAIGGAYSTIVSALIYIILTWSVGIFVWNERRDEIRVDT